MKRIALLSFAALVCASLYSCNAPVLQTSVSTPTFAQQVTALLTPNHTFTPSPDPTPVSTPTPTPRSPVIQLSAGNHCFFILCEDGSVWAWGKSQYGQLGDGTTEDRWKFVKTLDGVKKISRTSQSRMMIAFGFGETAISRYTAMAARSGHGAGRALRRGRSWRASRTPT